MTKLRRLFIPILICLITLLGACDSPSTPASTLRSDDPAYTSAAETIAVQLTDIANPTTEGPVTTGQEIETPQSGMGSPTETLPSTSTPLPTNTPLPSDTPQPSKTPIPSPTSESTGVITPTLAFTDPKASLGDPDWLDTFESGVNWPLYNDEHVEMEVKEGGLYMTALNPDKWESWMIAQPVLQDFYMEATTISGECVGWDRYGLLTRASDASHAYLYGFTCDGKYSLRIWDGEKFIMLVEWTPSESILAGPEQTNHLGFMATGNKIALYANGDLLTQVEDDTFTAGAFGLSISAFNTQEFVVQFTEVAYWVLP